MTRIRDSQPSIEAAASPDETAMKGPDTSTSHGVRSSAWLRAIVFMLPLILPIGSNAAAMSASDLLAACSGDATAKATCNGYLMAVTDMVLQRESRGRP